MSSDIAIKVDGLSKCYHIYEHPQDRLKQMVMPRLRRILGMQSKSYSREFWALKDVSFEIKKGETVGIIGRNGSGKSTLLQLICGTLNPTSGSIHTSGRVAALLELGSGFNPEFTGRENVYMNASVLGLHLEQIDARYSDIAAFADIGDFIDQPVKTYSSGMLVRLAFAVLAHVDADILVIDEALAVGDAVFTQKCMRFIRQFQKNGALIFVSHDTASVQSLCQTGIWLKNGRIEQKGTAKGVSQTYLQYTLQQIYGEESRLQSVEPDEQPQIQSESVLEPGEDAAPVVEYEAVAMERNNFHAAKGWKTGKADIISVSLGHLTPGKVGLYEGGERVRLTIRAIARESIERPILGFLVRDRLGQDLFGQNTHSVTSLKVDPISAGATFEGRFDFRLPMLPNGEYAVMSSIADGDIYSNVQHHWMHDALIIHVSSSKVRYGLVGIPFEQIRIEVVNA